MYHEALQPQVCPNTLGAFGQTCDNILVNLEMVSIGFLFGISCLSFFITAVALTVTIAVTIAVTTVTVIWQ